MALEARQDLRRHVSTPALALEDGPVEVRITELAVRVMSAAELPEVADPRKLCGDLLLASRVHLAPVRTRRERIKRRLDDWNRRGDIVIAIRPGEVKGS